MISRMVMLVALLAVSGLADAESTASSKLFLYSMLTDAKTNFELVGVKAVERDASPSRESLDIVAELLNERASQHVANGPDLDTIAWLMKALGASKNARYRPVIEHAMAVYSDEKVTKFGELALAQLTDASSAAYTAGTVSLDRLRTELAAERAAVVAGSKDISLLKPGHDIDAVFALMGYPDEVVEKVESRGHGVIRIHTHNIRLKYSGHGLIEIENQFQQNLGWRITEMWVDLPNSFGPYTGTAVSADDATSIMSTEPMALRRLAGQLVSKHVTDPEILDRVAERIRLSMASDDEYEAEALAYFCRLLGESGNSKYAGILAQVASGAKDSGVRRHAKTASENIGKSLGD